jgi:polyphosphate kinase
MKVPPTERPEETPAPGVHEQIKLVRVEEVIAANLDELFPGKEILSCYVFQVTRNADLVIEEDEASDLLQTIEDELAGRWFGQSVRLVVTDSMPAELREWLAENLRVAPSSVYATSEPLGLGDLEEFTHLDRGTCCTRRSRRTFRTRFGARAQSPRRSGRGISCSITPTTPSPRWWSSSVPPLPTRMSWQ